MKKKFSMFMAGAALAFGTVAAEKVWPAGYWQTVTNMMTAATPTGTATARPTISLAEGDSVSYLSSTYAQAVEARMNLMVGSTNAVADFSSFPPGTIFSIR